MQGVNCELDRWLLQFSNVQPFLHVSHIVDNVSRNNISLFLGLACLVRIFQIQVCLVAVLELRLYKPFIIRSDVALEIPIGDVGTKPLKWITCSGIPETLVAACDWLKFIQSYVYRILAHSECFLHFSNVFIHSYAEVLEEVCHIRVCALIRQLESYIKGVQGYVVLRVVLIKVSPIARIC